MRRSPNPSVKQPCARWGCEKTATYEKPLCYAHWKEWEGWELEECTRCHWFYGDDELTWWMPGVEAKVGSEPPFMCVHCTILYQKERGVLALLLNREEQEMLTAIPPTARAQAAAALAKLRKSIPEAERPRAPHMDMQRPVRWVYVIKLDDGAFYVGQTDDLTVRMQEHRDRLQRQTQGKNGKLVYFERFEGEREAVNARENELTVWNQDGFGQRRLRQLIESWRAPLRLLDLNA